MATLQARCQYTKEVAAEATHPFPTIALEWLQSAWVRKMATGRPNSGPRLPRLRACEFESFLNANGYDLVRVLK